MTPAVAGIRRIIRGSYVPDDLTFFHISRHIRFSSYPQSRCFARTLAKPNLRRYGLAWCIQHNEPVLRNSLGASFRAVNWGLYQRGTFPSEHLRQGGATGWSWTNGLPADRLEPQLGGQGILSLTVW
jgi:hypothetical protein